MKKFLLLLIAAVLLCTSGEFMASAETQSGVEDIIVDDDGTGGKVYSAGTWKEVKNDKAYGSKMKYADFNADSSTKFRWCPKIKENGYYKVYISMQDLEECSESVKVEVAYGVRGKYSKRICQKYYSGNWAELGTFYMAASDTPNVNNSVCLTADKTGAVCADAIKLVYVSDGVPAYDDIDLSEAYNENETVVLSDIKTGTVSLASCGKPYYIKGICLDYGADYAAKAGANTIRTYDSKISYAKSVLDRAQKLGMKVVLGISMKKDDGCYYNDPANFKADFENFKNQINAVKNHPSLLMWSVCNEIDDDKSGINEDVYKAINSVAAYIKATDAYHPVTCTQAGSKTDKISAVMKYCPNIDVLSFNVYGPLENEAAKNVDLSGWRGGYFIGEFGVDGTWESKTDNYGVPVEKSDSEKARIYAERYNYIFSIKNKGCFGSFLFASFGTYRASHTWYNMFFEKSTDGSKYKMSPLYDAMYEVWSGKKRDNYAPMVSAVNIDKTSVAPGQTVKITVSASDADNDELTYAAELRKYDYDKEYPASVRTVSNSNTLSLTVPYDTGLYGLYVYAYDCNDNIGHGKIMLRSKSDSVLAAKETFSGITDLSGYRTRDCFSNSPWKLSDDTEAKNNVVTKYGLNFAELPVGFSSIYNTLKKPIDYNSGKTYYIKWSFAFDFEASSRQQYFKVGFGSGDGAGTEFVAMKPKGSALPKIGLKLDGKLNYSGYVNKETLYDASLKIKTSVLGEDKAELKIWPHGCKEPRSVTVSYVGKIDGKAEKLFCESNSDSKCYFGNFLMDIFSDYSCVENAENDLRNGKEVKTIMCPYGGAAEAFLSGLKNYGKAFAISDIVYFDGDDRIAALGDNPSKIGIKFENDSEDTLLNEIIVVCAAEKDGKYEDIVGVTTRQISLGKGESEIVYCVINGFDKTKYDAIRTFVWKEDMNPFFRSFVADKNGIKFTGER
ncbi:MAG: glycoside hydrolase family 2 TIM barrel-domain containing protein [Clostridia bacterium]|nr:glycoside hydrolase family 2 TIM barrel-domain containing protein [Clostridia bacterium]